MFKEVVKGLAYQDIPWIDAVMREIERTLNESLRLDMTLCASNVLMYRQRAQELMAQESLSEEDKETLSNIDDELLRLKHRLRQGFENMSATDQLQVLFSIGTSVLNTDNKVTQSA